MTGKRVGFIGTGTMGGPMAEQVLQKHGALTVCDANRAAVDALAAKGATAAATPREVAAASDYVVTMLPHPDVLKTVALGEDGLIHGFAAGAVLIDMSTNGLEATKAVAAALAEKGVKMIDAPVGKGPWAAEKGELTILSAGDEQDCEDAKWLLSMMGSTVHYCGPLGSGQAIKLANNLAACATMSVLAEAYALAKAAGARLDVLTSMMPQTSADSWQLRHTMNGKILKGDFSPMFKLGLAHKDMQIIVAMAEQLGTPIDCGRASLAWYDKGMQAGYADLDWGAIMLTSNPELKGD